MPHPVTPMDAVPELDAGLNLLETPAHRTTALHQIALSHLRDVDGPAVWIDARGNAATAIVFDLNQSIPMSSLVNAGPLSVHLGDMVLRLP